MIIRFWFVLVRRSRWVGAQRRVRPRRFHSYHYGATSNSASAYAIPVPTRLTSAIVQSKLPPGANRILFVKNLSYNTTGEDLYELFGRYGSIRQIRIGSEVKTRGTAFVVYEDVLDVRAPVSDTATFAHHYTDSCVFSTCRPRMRWTTSTVSICKNGI